MNNFSSDQLERIREILGKTTIKCRKGKVIEEKEIGETTPGRPAMVFKEIFDMPTQDQMTADNIEFVDMHFIIIGVQTDIIENYRIELEDLLLKWPQPDRLASGPGFMELGRLLNDQGTALQFMALGKTLGFWDIITPKTLGLDGPIANSTAGQGMVCITGWRPTE